MKVMKATEASLQKCLRAAQRERVVVTQAGKPVALILGIKGMDLRKVEAGESAEFWALLRERRAQKKITRQELEKRLADTQKHKK
jgi:antitoxin (DNA-binding transcriptional repressor) of toxin-antitoxin stability system